MVTPGVPYVKAPSLGASVGGVEDSQHPRKDEPKYA